MTTDHDTHACESCGAPGAVRVTFADGTVRWECPIERLAECVRRWAGDVLRDLARGEGAWATGPMVPVTRA